MNNKILYVEDDEALGFVTSDSLGQEGFDVDHHVDGQQAKRPFKVNTMIYAS